MEALEKGSVYTAVIDGYSSEGLGIARVNGAVVFVPHAVRGEEIDLRITKVMKTSCAGEIVKIHNPSPERMEPECPYAGKCGGCAYRHLTYPEELWAKRQRVQDALTRIWGRKTRSITATRASTPWGLTAPSAFFRLGPTRLCPSAAV